MQTKTTPYSKSRLPSVATKSPTIYPVLTVASTKREIHLALIHRQNRVGSLQRRSRSRSAREANLGRLQLRLALGRYERMHPDLYARLRFDSGRNELETSHRNHTPRQFDR